MTADQRAEAYEEILEKSFIGVGVIGHEMIDAINIYQATFLAMKQAVARLARVPACVLVDGPKAPDLKLRQFPVVDGDALSLAIACASIVAKVTRDRIMHHYDTLYPEYGFKHHKGYGTEEHMDALKKHGPCQIHRRSFGPVRNSIKKIYA